MLLARENLQSLIDALWDRGYRCIGPRVRDHAVVYDELREAADLPWGVTVEQQAGRYRLTGSETGTGSGSGKAFAWAAPAQSIKPWLFTPRETLWRMAHDAQGDLNFEAARLAPKPLAILGARACDLAAVALQDRHFLIDDRRDDAYAARRAGLFIIAANCTESAATCFCASTGDGPEARLGFDMALTEVAQGFLLYAASESAHDLCRELPLSPAPDDASMQAREALQSAARQQRAMPAPEQLMKLRERPAHERWQAVGERCLSCGNCSLVCPSCFCHRHFELSELDGDTATHGREWDSCFSEAHSYIHGLTVRASIAQRYRQWLTHKLANWQTQYGRSGCVGCGRCITWCPVGIDLIEEARAITEHDDG